MAQAFDGIASDIEHLTEHVRELERRVAALENLPREASPAQLVMTTATLPDTAMPAAQSPKTSATSRGLSSVDTPAGAVSVVGKAVLGIAGAYLLRAISEWGTITRLPILILSLIHI